VSLSKIVEVEVPKLDGIFLMRIMSAEERDDHELSMLSADGGVDMKKMKNMRAKLVARLLVNSAGERIFKNGNGEKLGKLDAPIINALYERGMEINGMTESKDLDENLEDTLKKV
jgi:hypothetical protein